MKKKAILGIGLSVLVFSIVSAALLVWGQALWAPPPSTLPEEQVELGFYTMKRSGEDLLWLICQVRWKEEPQPDTLDSLWLEWDCAKAAYSDFTVSDPAVLSTGDVSQRLQGTLHFNFDSYYAKHGVAYSAAVAIFPKEAARGEVLHCGAKLSHNGRGAGGNWEMEMDGSAVFK